jgi:hypothetical protein
VRLEGLRKLNNYSPNRVSNLLPSGLYRSALTTTLPLNLVTIYDDLPISFDSLPASLNAVNLIDISDMRQYVDPFNSLNTESVQNATSKFASKSD